MQRDRKAERYGSIFFIFCFVLFSVLYACTLLVKLIGFSRTLLSSAEAFLLSVVKYGREALWVLIVYYKFVRIIRGAVVHQKDRYSYDGLFLDPDTKLEEAETVIL